MAATPSHIFIVGVSRSGTTLMRRILNRSSRVELCDENFFLGHLITREGMRYKFRRFGTLADDANVRRLVAWLYSAEFEHYSRFRRPNWQWEWFRSSIAPEVMTERLLATDRSDRAVFELLMDLYAGDRPGIVRGEKTPAHVRHVPTILEWFPEGRVIQMLRDPRGIYTSEVRRRREKSPHAPYRQLRRIPFALEAALLIQVTIAWGEAVGLAREYRRRFGDRHLLVRFEDLVAEPDRVVGDICDWLGIELEERMLEQSVVSEGFTHGAKGFDGGASRRWAGHISPVARWWLETRFGRQLAEFGYGVRG